MRPRVYAAHPVSSYGTEHEARCLGALRGLLPYCDVFDPAARYRSEHSWRRAWPRVLVSLAGLVVFAAEDGTIGCGCLRELADAIAYGLPVLALDGESLYELEGVRLLPPSWRSARRTGGLVLGAVIEPAEAARVIEAAQ